MKIFFSKFFYPILLLVLVGFLAWKNYTPGTILSGWDTLHPEFNFSLYFKRAFFGAWQEHQGVGAPAAQAHASELTRIPVIYLLSLIVPESSVRYSFFFLTWALGVLGAYFLAHYFLSERLKKYATGASFLVAIFYLLNLASLQQYFDPLEMFAVHFATFPWLILLASKYLKEAGKKNMLWFSLVTLLSSSMAHTATLFYAYFVGFSLFVFTVSLLSWEKKLFKRAVYLVVLTILLNLFWLGPNIYYVLKDSGAVTNSKISRIFTDEAYLQSRAFGNWKSLGILKNFPFNWREYDFAKNSFEDLTRVWDNHLGKPWVMEIGYGAVIFSVAGLLVAFFRKSKYAAALLPVLFISVFFWLVGIPQKLTFLREALRFPFTKFSIMLVSVLSVYLAFTSQIVMQILGKIKLGFIFVIFGAAAIVYFMMPVFQGNFIDPAMRVKIPVEYFEAFKWFNSHNHAGRVAKLPLQTFWDWNYYSWGYQGAGFTWFGIPQPTLDREFDRWGLYNEDFYFQSSHALYGNDPEAFYLALKKYQVKYLLLDESVINPGGSPNVLYFSQLKNLISKSGYIHKVAQFGFLTVYETNFDFGDKFISVPKTEIVNTPVTLSKGKLLVDENLSVNRGFASAYNCDLKKVGQVFKENSVTGILYQADGGGVSCDYLNYPDLKYGNAYILRVVGENYTGRGLKIYFTNYLTTRAELEELLPNGKFDEFFSIYPSKLDGAGYSLNFETRSYGRIASENLLTKVEIYEATPAATTKPQGEYDISNNLSIFDVQKYGTWAYKVETKGEGLLELGQGYEDGWVAIQTQDSRLKTLDHVKVNSWANGWILPANSLQTTDHGPAVSGRLSTVVLIYWPQLLEWGGGILGLLTLLFIGLY